MATQNTDTDIELYITRDVPSYIIEVFVPDDRKYSLTEDRMSLTSIRRQFDKEQGISRIGDVTLLLKNDANRYSITDASSIFYGKQHIGAWVRVIAGWGPRWANSPAVQFQGRIKSLKDTSNWTATMIIYDALKDFQDAAVGSGNTNVLDADNNAILQISETQVPGMNPIDILEYLVDTTFGIKWFNMDTLLEESALDATSMAAAKVATEGTRLGSTIWPDGSKLLDMVTDMMKMIGGYVYTGKDGKINVNVFAPSQTSDADRSLYNFIGDVTVKEPEIILSQRDSDKDSVVNQVSWKYGQAQTEYGSERDETSIEKYGLKNLNLTTKWELHNSDTLILDIATSRLLSRWAEPMAEYDAAISWLRNGDGLALDLGNFVSITDPALAVNNEVVETHRMEVNLETQVTKAVLYDASALQGKFWFFSSEVDEGDGLGITANNFAVNWLERFLFFSNNDTDNKPAHDPSGNNNGTMEATIPPIDDWGNGIEENFIWW